LDMIGDNNAEVICNRFTASVASRGSVLRGCLDARGDMANCFAVYRWGYGAMQCVD
jgi:hypothetical protein